MFQPTLRTLTRTLTLTAALALTALPAHAQSILCDDSIRTQVGRDPDMFTQFTNLAIHDDLIAMNDFGAQFSTEIWRRTAPDTWIRARTFPFEVGSHYHFTDNLLMRVELPYFDPTVALHLYDISDPENIQRRGSIPGDGTYNSGNAFILRDDLIIAAFTEDHASFYDITDPDNPTLHTALEIPDLRPGTTIAASDTYLYVRTETALAVVDFADPTNPLLINELPGAPFDNAIPVAADNHTLVATSGDDILLFSLTDPNNPQHVSTITAPDPSTPLRFPSFEPASHRLSLIAGSDVLVYDISDPRTPLRIGTKPLGSTPSAVSIHDGSVATLNSTGRYVEPLGTLVPDGPEYADLLPQNGHRTVELDASILYSTTVINNDTIIRSTDIADPNNPVALDELTVDPVIFETHIQGTTLFAASNNGYLAFDITDPATITQLGSLESVGYTNSITVDNQTAYILNPDTRTVTALDVTDQSNPAIISDVDITAPFCCVFTYSSLTTLDGRLMVQYVDDISGPRSVLVDVTDPAAMTVLNNALRIIEYTADANYIYSNDDFQRLQVRLRENGFESAPIATIDVPNPTSFSRPLRIIDDRLIMFQSRHPLIFDLSDPTAPTLLGEAYLPQGKSRASNPAFSTDTVAMVTANPSQPRSITLFSLDSNCRACAADFNADSTTSPDDITAFLGALANQHPTADLNDDGQTDYYDINAFLRIYTNQCPG
jgi:hypothetical protein